MREVYGEDLPVPRKAIYGPINITDRIIELDAGDEIGILLGDIFFIRFLDKNDFIINANTCLELFNNRGFFYY